MLPRNLFRKNLSTKIAVLVGALMVACAALFFLCAVILGYLPLQSGSDGGKLAALSAGFIAIAMAVTAWIVGRSVGRPIHKLIDVMRVAEAGDFLVRADVSGDDDLGLLSAQFNDMLSRLTDMAAKNIDKERELIVAKEELKYKKILEKKTRLIQKRDKELGARLKDLSILYNINQVVSSTIELKELLTAVNTVVADTFGYKEFAILLQDADSKVLRVVSFRGLDGGGTLLGMEFQPGEGISGLVAQTGKRILIEDTSTDKRYLHYKGQKKEEGSFLCLPIKVKDKVLGVFNVNNPKTNGFSPYDIRLLTALANYLAVGVENARLYEATRQLSLTDDLTGLFNRRYLFDRLDHEWQRAKRFSQPLSVIIADIDYFKTINDRYGHLQGDEILRDIARILQGHTRGIDMVGRYGGEEFVIVLPQTHKTEAIRVADKLRMAVKDHQYLAGDVELEEEVTISMGISCYPETCQDQDTLLKQADMALYQAKSAGRNMVKAFEKGKSPILSVIKKKHAS